MIFAKAGVLPEGGDGLFAGNAKGFIRLNLAMPRALVKEGLKRVCRAVKEYPSARAVLFLFLEALFYKGG